MSVWSLYIIQCKNGSLYTGITTDVQRRFHEHQGNTSKTAKYLRGKAPLTLVFQKEIGNRSAASKIELIIKKLPRTEKLNIISGVTSLKYSY